MTTASRLVVVVVLALVASAVIALRWSGGDDPDGGSPYPEAWDARVEKYAEVVEEERGLEFDHPVHVDFLDVEEFKKQVTADEQDLTDEDRQEIKEATGLFRALGLLEDDLDLLETLNELRGAGIVGYYSHDDKRIRMRGQKLTPDVRSTLVHELTHALQDQHFDLGGRLDELQETDDSAAEGAFEALVEGDARRIETAWTETLDKDERVALTKAQGREGRRFAEDASDVPDVLETLMAVPYVFGEALLRVAVADGGEDRVDALFKEPPTTEEHLFDPWTFVADEDDALEVATPELSRGEEEFDSGQLGAIGWLLVLAERIPAKAAVEAVDGWGGDSYVAYRRADVSCVKVHYRADTDPDLRQMEAALTQWAARMPDARAGIEEDGLLTFESCESGGGPTSEPSGGSRAAVTSAVARSHLSATLVEVGLDRVAAVCGAERLLEEFSLRELNDPSPPASRMRAVVESCVSRPLP